MNAVLQGLCEDLLQARHGQWGDASLIDAGTFTDLFAELDDPALRETVLRLCVAVVESDGHVADGESLVLVNAVEQWGLHRTMLAPAR